MIKLPVMSFWTFMSFIYFVTVYNDIHKNIHYILEAIFIFPLEGLL